MSDEPNDGSPYITSGDLITGSPLLGWQGRFDHAQNMTFAQWTVAADATAVKR